MSTHSSGIDASTKREVIALYEQGNLSEDAVRDIIGPEWEEFENLDHLLEVLTPDEEDFEDDDLLL